MGGCGEGNSYLFVSEYEMAGLGKYMENKKGTDSS